MAKLLYIQETRLRLKSTLTLSGFARRKTSHGLPMDRRVSIEGHHAQLPLTPQTWTLMCRNCRDWRPEPTAVKKMDEHGETLKVKDLKISGLMRNQSSLRTTYH